MNIALSGQFFQVDLTKEHFLDMFRYDVIVYLFSGEISYTAYPLDT